MASSAAGDVAPDPLPTVVPAISPDSHASDDEADETNETMSLTDSVVDYPEEWGRRFHKYKEGSYYFPNDDPEQERIQHSYWAIQSLLRYHGVSIYSAPLDNPRSVLDVGTGTGQWPLDMAEMFPHANITGIDLSPIQPREVPENVFFEIQDCSESDWARPLASMDYIRSSIMLGSLSSFSTFVQTAKRYLKPGTGWLECHELNLGPFSDDNTIPERWPFATCVGFSKEAMALAGRPMDIADKIAKWMREAGLVDVTEHIYKMPLNPWPRDPLLKQIGKMWEANIYEGLPAFTYKPFGAGLGWSRTQVETFLADVRKAIRDRHVHSYQQIHVVYGRRPSPEEDRAVHVMPAPPPWYRRFRPGRRRWRG